MIEEAFKNTRIKYLSLPSSIREIESVCKSVDDLESIYVMNDLYVSNKEQTAIFSKDSSELICVIPSLEDFKIQEVSVNRKNVVIQSMHFTIPASIETVEKCAFFCYDRIIEFETGSKLRSFDFEAFSCRLESLIINNENFIMSDSGVAMSLNPRGIVFVPSKLREISRYRSEC